MEGQIAAYFDLDGTLLNASSEKTLTAHLAKRRPWRIPWGAVAWTSGFLTNLLRGRSVYDAARNRGHLKLVLFCRGVSPSSPSKVLSPEGSSKNSSSS